jgi:3-dehydroshikimate dehydratase
MIRLGLSSQALLTSTTEEVLAFARDAGFEGIEWAGEAHVASGNKAGAEALMLATLMAGLSVVSFAPLYRVCAEGENGLGFASILETASILQSPVVRIFAGTKPLSRMSEAERDSLCGELSRIGDLAGARGVSLCLSLGRNTGLDNYAAAAALFAKLRHPFVGLAWEALPGSSPIEATAALENSGAAVRLLLARSADRGGRSSPLSEQAEDWKRRLELYRSTEPDPKLSRFVLLGRTGGSDEGRLREDLAALTALTGRGKKK